jgi:hypothetical protein
VHDLMVAPEPTWLLPQSAVSVLITDLTGVLTIRTFSGDFVVGNGNPSRGSKDCGTL